MEVQVRRSAVKEKREKEVEAGTTGEGDEEVSREKQSKAAYTTNSSAPLLSELPASNFAKEEEKEGIQSAQNVQNVQNVVIKLEKARIEKIDIIDCLSTAFAEIEGERLSKWKIELGKQDIYTLSDIISLEEESMKLLSGKLTVKCYDCVLKLRKKCTYIIVCIDTKDLTGGLMFSRLNGIYVQVAGQNFLDNPLFRQIVSSNSQNKNVAWNQFCIYSKGKRWRIGPDGVESREQGKSWFMSDDDILNRAKKASWNYYCLQDKAFKPYVCKAFDNDVIVDYFTTK